MCTHLHHDHVGWNTQLRNGRWVPTFPNARYVISKPDFEYYRDLDADPNATEPVEFGTFRESVLPILDAGRADLVSGRCRLDEHLEIIPAPGHSAGHVVFKLREQCALRPCSSATCCTTSFRFITRTGISPRTAMPRRARTSRRKVLGDCAASGALMLPAHVGAPFAGRIEATAQGFRPVFTRRGGRRRALGAGT